MANHYHSLTINNEDTNMKNAQSKEITIKFKDEKQIFKFMKAVHSISDDVDQTTEGNIFCDIYFGTIQPCIEKCFKSNISNFKEIIKIVKEEVETFNKKFKNVVPYKVEVRKDDICVEPETRNFSIWIDELNDGYIKCTKTENCLFYDKETFRKQFKSSLNKNKIHHGLDEEVDFE